MDRFISTTLATLMLVSVLATAGVVTASGVQNANTDTNTDTTTTIP